MTASAVPAVPAPPPFTFARGVLFGVGIGIPVLAALAFVAPHAALPAGAGALLALLTDPRRRLVARAVAIGIALLVVLLAAVLGVLLQHDRIAVAAAVVIIAFAAGLPRPSFPYLTLVGKMAAALVIITSMGFSTSPVAAIAFLAGGLFALAAIVIEVRWRDARDAGSSPFDEWRAIWAGDTNPLFYAITLSATVALAMVVAVALNARLPGWVGLTVLFVMHPDDAMAVRNIAQRIGGTLAGIIIAGALVHIVHAPLALAVACAGCAVALPRAQAANFFWFSLAVTVLILLLFDLALLSSGGDAPLLLWRFYDTVLGCAAVAVALTAVRALRRWRARSLG